MSGTHGLWVFGYGSLMWRPGFPHEEAVHAILAGAHRALCIYSHVHRGTPRLPGLVLGLDAGGRCEGIAYYVPPLYAQTTLGYLRRREQQMPRNSGRQRRQAIGAELNRAFGFRQDDSRRHLCDDGMEERVEIGCLLREPRQRGASPWREAIDHRQQLVPDPIARDRHVVVGRVMTERLAAFFEELFHVVARPVQEAVGAVLVDGTDIRQLDPADLRRNIGCVLQDGSLFFGSVKDNITLGAPYVEEASIIRAATVAGVDGFIKGHPLGFDLPVGEGGRMLSGGQRQAIVIARALLMDPPILVLDEPTSSMDNSTETAFKNRLGEILAGRTLMLVTHRNSMLSLVDRLIVIDGGKVVADGPKATVLDALMKGRITAAKA